MRLKLPDKVAFGYDEFETVDLDNTDDLSIDELIDLEEETKDEARIKLEDKYDNEVSDFSIYIYPVTRTVECEDIEWEN